jgi:hypothetical protein
MKQVKFTFTGIQSRVSKTKHIAGRIIKDDGGNEVFNFIVIELVPVKDIHMYSDRRVLRVFWDKAYMVKEFHIQGTTLLTFQGLMLSLNNKRETKP